MSRNNVCILVCEDDSGIRDVLMIALRDAGYKPASADARDAERCIRSSRAAIVLLDLTLGSSSGADILSSLQAKGAPSAKIILMSAHSNVADIAKRHDVDYIMKPFELKNLYAVIERNL
jgi:DNA-binding NtrC family response regulator